MVNFLRPYHKAPDKSSIFHKKHNKTIIIEPAVLAGKSLAHPHTPIFPRTWVIRLRAVEIPKPRYIFYLFLSIRSLSVTVVSYIIRPSSDISHHSVIRTTPVDYGCYKNIVS